ncbi:beta-ketoacyl synthase N-terminal-like domain-containing protein [Streptomyces melanogenes]|uniref:beta-ketoacyl synthase N-terminal-like domain-containing protein n=1 Tax=Streptomyces melanogenes TaxID=67326 RepID=UPI00167EA566|nr:beta-ketoacyl synthase N-terminal-like domain-containing protein [Streptomyces melanogenes]GGP84035.1 hypothetical protein GCM10010278_73170 [Streptomyces melanogenes]
MTTQHPTQKAAPPAVPGALAVVGSGFSAVDGDGKAPRLPGFVASPFAPLVYDAVRRCLGAPDSEDSPVAHRGERTAIVLGSLAGDAVTADLAGEKVACGGVAEPVLFHQTVTTAVLGVIARDYRITGPVTCVSAVRDTGAALLDSAALLLEAQEAEQVLAVLVELAAGPRTLAALAAPTADPLAAPAPHRSTAVALLLRTPGDEPVAPRVCAPPVPATATARLFAYAATAADRGVR